jgi:hypothetical protein
MSKILTDRALLEQALEALTWCEPEGAVVTAARSAAIDALRAALAQEEQREQDARAEQIMSEIWAQPDQTYEYIGAKLAENMKKAMKNRARVSIEAVRSALEQDEREPGFWGRVAARQSDKIKQLETALAALKQPEQEPVARVIDDGTPEGSTEWILCSGRQVPVKTGDLLYPTPPRREWQGLTDEDVGAIRWGCRWNTMSTDDSMILTTKDQVDAFARAIEAALKERNHD